MKLKENLVVPACFSGLLFLSLLLSFRIGSVPFSVAQIFDILSGGGSQPDRTILLQIRLPRVLLASLTGASLALSGACLQGLFRNPLADPYMLGLSSGGSLGAAIALLIFSSQGGMVTFCSFLGAFLTAFLIYRIARTEAGLRLESVLLSGIALGLTFSALQSLFLSLNEHRASELILWLMGHLTGSFESVGWVFVCLVIGIILILGQGDALNALLEGEASAASIGIETERVKLRILLACSILVAGSVAFCGVIGFVGLIVPHLTRLILGPDHRKLLPYSCLGGAILLNFSDLVARVGFPGGELPVGIVTGCLGGPFFLWILRRGMRAS